MSARVRRLRARVFAPWGRLIAFVDPRWFYIGLALVLGAWVVASTVLDRSPRHEAASYDWMMRHRVRTPTPDPTIVLIDIDERSLAALAPDYGRWPWPRDVLATVLAELEAQGARAAVFDILVSDADVQHPVSDRAFADAVAASRIAYFPALRLDPANDAASKLTAKDLRGLVVPRPGATPTAADETRTFAVALPFFDSAMKSGRLGTHNVDPDPDSLVRRYRLFEDVGAWRVLSLPARLALDFGWTMPADAEKTLRFNAAPLAYRRVSFADLYADLLRRDRQRPRDEFKGAIVVIGATASNLFDLKGTPLSSLHPGVDLMATAIDDTKNDRFVDELSRGADLAIALALLVLMAWLAIRFSHEQLRAAFLVAPALLFAISWLTLNFVHTFVDLATPASVAFLYFTVVKAYSAQVRRRWNEGPPHVPMFERGVAQWTACVAARLTPEQRRPGFETRYLSLLRTTAPNVRLTWGLEAQGSWSVNAFADVLFATWVEAADDADALARDRDEAEALQAGFATLHRRGREVVTAYRERTIPAVVDGRPHTKRVDDTLRMDRLRALVGEAVRALERRGTS